MLHVAEGVDAGDEHCHGDDQCEEQRQGIHFQADAEGPAFHGLPVAQPVSNDLAVDEDGLDQTQDQDQGCCHGDQRHGIACRLAAAACQRGDERTQKQGDYRQNRKVSHKFH